MLPSLFLAHGSPMIALEDTDYTRFLKELGKKYQPKAIVIFTAHWESDVLTVSSHDGRYDTIYDFGGFPPELYELKYPAPGSTQAAAKVIERFETHGIPVRTDASRGLDHGSWTLLYHLYPKADIPVVQVSVNPLLSPAQQYAIGESLRGLGEDDILVIGSGVTVHNLRMLRFGQKQPEDWAVAFDEWLIHRLRERDLEALFHYEEQAPGARMAVPRAEHFVPFYIAMGSGNPHTDAKVIHRGYDYGTLSYLCFEF